MIKRKWIGPIAALLMAASVLFLGIGYFSPSAYEAVIGQAEPSYVSAMDKTKVLGIQIIADENDWAEMLENARAEEYIPATIILDGVKLENVGIRPKGNSSLSMVAQDDTTDRYSFKIEFDHYISEQSWLGLDKIVVNNMQGDSTYMKEYLSYDLMAYIGVNAPLYAFSNISVNGEAWGFYLAVESLEDSYAARVYGNDHGKLYKPESMGMRGSGKMNEFVEGIWGSDWAASLPGQENAPETGQQPEQGRGQIPTGQNRGEPTAPEQETGRDGGFSIPGQENEQAGNFHNMNPGGAGGGFGGAGGGFGSVSGGSTLQYTDDEISSYSAIFDNAVFKSTDQDYARVIAALKKLDSGEDLDSVVDVEATLKYFAAHTVIANFDSYLSSMSHNYYLYEKDGQLTMLPWDFNLAFGGFQSGGASSVVNFPIDTPVSGIDLEDRPILAKLLEVPEYLALYHSYLQEIVEGYFDSGLFVQTIDSLDALISSYVEADPSAFDDFTAYQSGVAELKKLGALRAESMKGQLSGSIPATSAGQSENPGALVDASEISLSALGSMGGGQAPGGQRGEENSFSPGESPNGQTAQTTASVSGFYGGSWQLLGICVFLLLGTLLFIIFYKRRKKS